MGSLFPLLPDEIGWDCLLRVELNSHHNLRCVCKSWNNALKNPHFYQERKRLKISEQRICMLQKIDGICDRVAGVAVYDLEKNSLKSLPPIPAEIKGFPHLYFVKQKLVLIKDMFQDSTGSCVWLYDFPCSKWRQGAKMPMVLRGAFTSGADEHGGLIYIAGGFTRRGGVSVYNVEEDKWDVLPDINVFLEGLPGAFADGKFYVMGTPGTFEVYDSYTRRWTTLEIRFNNWCCFVSGLERLHYLSVRELIEYDYSQDKQNIVGTFPTDWVHFIKSALVVSNKIFVCRWDPIEGGGFYMVEFPSERGGTFKVFGIEKPSGLQGSVICAALLDL